MKTINHRNKGYRYAEGGSVKKSFYDRGEVDESPTEYDKPKIDPEIGIRTMSSAGPLKKVFDYIPSTASAAITGDAFASNREVDDKKRATVRAEKKRSRTDRASGE